MCKEVLVVDDDPDNISFLKTVLEDNGYEVVTAEIGEVGLAKAKEFKPELILLDFIMPKKSGTGFLNEIKKDEEIKNIPIKVEITPQAYLEKPIEPSELIETIKKLIG